MYKTLAYADEYGNNSFDFETQGSHFVVTSILIKENEKEEIEKALEAIRLKYFQTGEIKSKKVADNVDRRKLILRDIAKLNFKVFSVVIDKRKLFGDGFAYKKSFYKFSCGLVYKELFKTYPQLSITVDEHGGNEFMLSFKRYVQINHIRDLFGGSEFFFESSDKNVLIQLADFVCGTIGRCYDESKNDGNLPEYLKILEKNLSSIRHFPQELNKLSYAPSEEEKGYDPVIAELSTGLAIDFIETKKNILPEDSDQINLLRLLLLYQKAFGPSLYISSTELMRHLKSHREKDLSEQFFRAKIVGKIRDAGVLIASSSHGERKGYKLPTNMDDIYNFVNHGNSQIIPMLSRIKKCRDSILLATHNAVDILGKPNYKELKVLTTTLAKENI